MYNYIYIIYNKILLFYVDFYDMYILLVMRYYVEIFLNFVMFIYLLKILFQILVKSYMYYVVEKNMNF